jgi:hypothetical protein
MEDAMKEEKTLDRREFTLAAAMAALSGVAITISACGGGGSPSSPTPTPTPAPTPTPPVGATDKNAVIGSNHGHAGTITAAQLTAGGTLSLDIRGDATHPHTVELTGADMTSIAANQRVSKESSTDSGHSHSVTFN